MSAARLQLVHALRIPHDRAEGPAPQPEKPRAPSLTRSQSFSIRAGALHAAAPDDDALWTCPISYTAFCEPVLASDGYTYERSGAEQLRGHSSPMTREPLEILALHPVKRMWAMQNARVPTSASLRDSRPDAAHDFKARVITLQRALAQVNRASADALQPQLFHHLQVVADLEQSAALFRHLRQHEVLNPLPRYRDQVLDAAPQSALDAARVCGRPLTESQKETVIKILGLVAQEATRSQRARAHIALLGADLALLARLPGPQAHAAERLRRAQENLAAVA